MKKNLTGWEWIRERVRIKDLSHIPEEYRLSHETDLAAKEGGCNFNRVFVGTRQQWLKSGFIDGTKFFGIIAYYAILYGSITILSLLALYFTLGIL